MDEVRERSLQLIIDGHRQIIAGLESLLGDQPHGSPTRIAATNPWRDGGVFDPEKDEPDVAPDPNGTRRQKDWCGLVILGRLRAVNQRKGRGANKTECVEISEAAGYKGGKGWTGSGDWLKAYEDNADGRWLTADKGMDFLRHYYEALGLDVPEDLV